MIDPRYWDALKHPEKLEPQADENCRRCGGIGYALIRNADLCDMWRVIADPVDGSHRYRVGERIPCHCTNPINRAEREVTELYLMFPGYGKPPDAREMDLEREQQMQGQCGVNDPDESEAIE